MKSFRTLSLSLPASLACAAVVAFSGTARAASIDCSNSANVPNPVYIAGSSASKSLILGLAKSLGSSVSLIYASIPSCQGLDDVLAQPAQAETTTPSFASPTQGYLTCTKAGAAYGSFAVDIAISDVVASSCISPQVTVGAGYSDFVGPIQAFEIAVPWASTEFAISAEAAYVVFGFGGQGYVVNPWNDPTAIWTRGDTSGTEIAIAEAIGLSAAKWGNGLSAEAGAAQQLGNATLLTTALLQGAAAKPNTTIGILASSNVDPLKSPAGTNDAGAATGGLKPLAFQATNQDCSYYADSDLSHYDKINVRQGRYAIWGPQHFVANVDGSGHPTVNPQGTGNLVPSSQQGVETVINVITHSGLSATSTPTLQQAIANEANAYFIPQCAMQVSRTVELGPEASYQPPQGCGCYFESLTGGGTTLSSYCTKCTTDADCGEGGSYPHCNFGYCEAQ